MRHDKLSSEEIEARRKLELLDLPDAIAHMENGGQVYRYGSEDRFFYKIEDGVLLCRCNELGGWCPARVSLRDNDKLYLATVDWHCGEFPLRVWTTLLPLPNRNRLKQEKEAVNAEDTMTGRLAAARASRDLQVERIVELEMDIETWKERHAELEKRCANLRAAGKLAAEESINAHAQLRQLQSTKATDICPYCEHG